MKCTACGYEKRSMWIDDNKISRYKSGKKKGQIKSTDGTRRDIFADDPEFKEVQIGNGSVLDFTTKGGYMSEQYVTVYACPNCGTLKIDI